MTEERHAWVDALLGSTDIDAIVNTAQALIRCPSVNPPGDERETSAIVRAHLQELMVRDLDIVRATDRRESVVARWGNPAAESSPGTATPM